MRASLREYVLIAQEVRRIDHFRRDGDAWVLTEVSDPEAPLVISTLGCSLKLADVYDRVEFSPAARAERTGWTALNAAGDRRYADFAAPAR